MIKCKVHIYNGNVYMDDDVCIEIKLPCLPPINSILYCDIEKLMQQATSNTEIAQRYIDWFYLKSIDIEIVEKENLEDLSFDDAIYIYSICFIENKDYVSIELNKEQNIITNLV